MPTRIHSSFAVHPGEWLRTEVVEPTGMTVTDLAEYLGVSRQALSAVLNGRAGLSGDMAMRFEKAFGLKTETLLRMKAAHEAAIVRQHEGDIDVRRLQFA